MLRTGADPTGGGAPYPLKAPAVCVVGPTASGKTDLAQALALELDGEVISADSMQIYRGMDIGTGKLPASERLVPHHGFDLVDPGEPFSAALFQNYAGEQVGNPVRERYQALAREQGAEALWKLLAARDEASASVIPPADVKRVVRAFELLEEGTTYAEQRAKLAHIPQLVPAVFFGMAVDPDVLRARIDARVDAMVETGLVAEVEGLLDRGFREGVTAPQAIGYKEIVEALDGFISLDEAAERIKLATRRYAKRQRTWFRKDARIRWLDATSRDIPSLVEEALELLDDGVA